MPDLERFVRVFENSTDGWVQITLLRLPEKSGNEFEQVYIRLSPDEAAYVVRRLVEISQSRA